MFIILHLFFSIAPTSYTSTIIIIVSVNSEVQVDIFVLFSLYLM